VLGREEKGEETDREKERERRAKCRVSTLTLRNYAYRLKNLQILIRVIIRKKSIILCTVLSFLSFAFFRNEALSSRYACTRFEIGIVLSSLSQIFSRIILHILNKPLAYQLKNIGRPMDEILQQILYWIICETNHSTRKRLKFCKRNFETIKFIKKLFILFKKSFHYLNDSSWDRFYKKKYIKLKKHCVRTRLYTRERRHVILHMDALISDVSTNEMYRVVSIVELCVD